MREARIPTRCRTRYDCRNDRDTVEIVLKIDGMILGLLIHKYSNIYLYITEAIRKLIKEHTVILPIHKLPRSSDGAPTAPTELPRSAERGSKGFYGFYEYERGVGVIQGVTGRCRVDGGWSSGRNSLFV